MKRSSILVFGLVLTLGGQGVSQAFDDLEHLARIRQRDETDAAITRGLAWLVTQQDPAQGWFAGKLRNTYTGLSCMALMAAGQFPGRTEHGAALRRGLLFLADVAERENGYFGKEASGRMYTQGICALALLEGYGMLADDSENRRIRDAARKAIQVIVQAQVKETKSEHFGGWRYEPDAKDADLSLTVWQVLCLRSAENCGLEVPPLAVSNAIRYVRSVYNQREGGYAYQANRNLTPSMRCAGVVCLRALGEGEQDPDRKQIENSASFLLKFDPAQTDKHFFYQSYYVANAANMMGETYRDAVLPRLEQHLRSIQKPDGSFENFKGFDGGVYSTAFSLVCLAVRYQYLPIYQE